MGILERHNVKISGRGRRAMLFAHGFGCDQNMWRFVAPAFEERFRVILFDQVGAGGSDLSAYDPDRYGSLQGYAEDVVALARELGIRDGVFVGHSVSAMVGMLAAKQTPELFSDLVLVGPSPRYIDDEDYMGGFSEAQIHELLDFLDSNHMGWSQAMAPVIMGNPERPELGEELTNSFCRTDLEIARRFARATFLSDNRADLEGVATRARRRPPGGDPSADLTADGDPARVAAGVAPRLLHPDRTGRRGDWPPRPGVQPRIQSCGVDN